MLNMYCKEIVFHFNKKHLEDPTVPMWILKTKGETYYVSHVDCQAPWSTKETPNNAHTKGSIKIKDAVLSINDNNEATISKPGLIDKIKLRNQKQTAARIIFTPDGPMHKALLNNEFEHSKFKLIQGACTSSFVICDLLNKGEAVLAKLKYEFRILQPNEVYYQAYDQKGDKIDADYSDPDTPYEYS